jgi:sugar phosphate isomerase/epimerase
MQIGCMVWRIGDLLDFGEQIDWLRRHRFEAVAFWTCAGQTGVWQGFDVAGATDEDIGRLCSELGTFPSVDLHAAVPLPAGSREEAPAGSALEELQRTVEFAGKIGAATVTVHIEDAGQDAPESPEALVTDLGHLNYTAHAAGVRIGLELTHSYGLALQADTPQIGLTLDVGHVSFDDGAGYREFGSIGGLIEHVGQRLFHVHVHDYDGVHDHIPIGAGQIEWPPIAAALQRIGYRGVLCLELNPERASPEDILESRDRLLGLLEGTTRDDPAQG